ncbi:hypothetical protein EVAR_34051_1 [Eumeta japonica]|uniref:Uncharacterized protein n=1 Tax=Eumeta variegata TaxID=151549 RepID=A0A4C1VR96_EUMVA|nr:hypothetical protein EVAR_34051_1 [Eumeta japonica]
MAFDHLQFFWDGFWDESLIRGSCRPTDLIFVKETNVTRSRRTSVNLKQRQPSTNFNVKLKQKSIQLRGSNQGNLPSSKNGGDPKRRAAAARAAARDLHDYERTVTFLLHEPLP